MLARKLLSVYQRKVEEGCFAKKFYQFGFIFFVLLWVTITAK